jgi:ribosome recycling factor
MSVLTPIERAIQKSDIGINPQNDGKTLRMIFPPLTEERRKELVKDVKELAEDCKVRVRNVRRETVDKFKTMKKGGEITEDDLKQAEKKTQELTDRFIKEIDVLAEKKQKEIMSI